MLSITLYCSSSAPGAQIRTESLRCSRLCPTPCASQRRIKSNPVMHAHCHADYRNPYEREVGVPATQNWLRTVLSLLDPRPDPRHYSNIALATSASPLLSSSLPPHGSCLFLHSQSSMICSSFFEAPFARPPRGFALHMVFLASGRNTRTPPA